jgi:hypothetical protein
MPCQPQNHLQWDKIAAKIFEEVQAWQEAHPEAKFVEIEEAIDQSLAKLRSQILMVTECRELSYFSRLAQAAQFGRQALVETQRRGLSENPKVSAVLDGAQWLQGFVDLHCPKATRILDFPQAAQRLSGIDEVIWGKASAEAKSWLSHKLHQLKHTAASDLLTELAQLQLRHPEQPLIEENLNYLKKRQSQLDYVRFSAEGHPIGSGIVESANKNVVQTRLKGPGTHWHRANVNPRLALRNLEWNERWQEGWAEIEALKKQARQARRQARREVRQAEVKMVEMSVVSEVGQVSSPILPQAARARAAYNGQPAAAHPWRRGKIGRAVFNLAKVS